MRHRYSSARFLLFCSVLVVTLAAQDSTTAGPRDQIQQLTTQLQQSPGDQALRERIIALVLTLNPKPATPDAVTMSEGAAEYAFKNAKTTADYSDAAKQYEKALLLAPWLADDYFNCGVAHEKAGENKEAIRSFNLYLLAAPNANDAQVIKKRIGGLQYVAQKAEDEANSPEAKMEQFIKTLDGGVWRRAYSYDSWDGAPERITRMNSYRNFFVEIHGHQIRSYDNSGYEHYKTMFNTRQFDVNENLMSSHSSKITINEDGQSITQEFDSNDGRTDFRCRLIYERIR